MEMVSHSWEQIHTIKKMTLSHPWEHFHTRKKTWVQFNSQVHSHSNSGIHTRALTILVFSLDHGINGDSKMKNIWCSLKHGIQMGIPFFQFHTQKENKIAAHVKCKLLIKLKDTIVSPCYISCHMQITWAPYSSMPTLF